MPETQQQQQQHRPGTRARGGGGEIVEVQGGHIVRSTGRKDRHSKVCTAKGPRDRRVRLSAHTAIQFYDVQDRLGYDRPSKAVDWLIKHAKAAIDELAELPPWRPSTASAATTTSVSQRESHPPAGDTGKTPMETAADACGFGFGSASGGVGGGGGISFLPPSLDSDAIADTIKSFFPMAAAAAVGAASDSSSNYQNYAPPTAQDLRLSLQSFQGPVIHQHHQPHAAQPHHSIFSGSATLAFESGSAGWSELGPRMASWNVTEPSASGGGGGAVFGFTNAPPPMPQAMPVHPMVLGQSQIFTQRGPLQSSNSPSVRAWMDPIIATAAPPSGSDLSMLHPAALLPSVSGMPGGFAGFRIPARFQGEEEHDGISDKPSSASSASRH